MDVLIYNFRVKLRIDKLKMFKNICFLCNLRNSRLVLMNLLDL